MTHDGINLVFCKPLNNKNPINLVFGQGCDDEEGAKTHEIRADIGLYQFVLDAEIVVSQASDYQHSVYASIDLHQFSLDSSFVVEQPKHAVYADIDLYGFAVNADIKVDYGINDNLVSSKHAIAINASMLAKNTYNILLNASLKLKGDFFDRFKNTLQIKYRYELRWSGLDKLISVFSGDWFIAEKLSSIDVVLSIQGTYKQASRARAYWQLADKSFISSRVNYGDAVKITEDRSFIFSEAVGTGYNYNAAWNIADTFTNKKNIVLDIAGLPSSCGPSIRPPVVPPTLPDDEPKVITKNLVFCKKPNNQNPINLIFGDECQVNNDYSIPEKGVYIVQNNLEIFRADDNRIIKAFAVEIGANRSDYLWNGSLSLPFSELEKIADTPEIEININQYKFVVDVNDITVKQAFNSKLIEVSVSSTTHRLKTIKAHNLERDASSIAIMSAQLSRDDLETGFKFVSDNGADWVIPDSTIEYDSASALDIINSIALAVGDTVISHAHNKQIIVKERHSTDKPIYSLPVGKLFEYGIDEEESEDYNAIVVTGENNGISAIVRKDGTAGNKIAPMIVNKLITGQDAARRSAINAIFNTSDRSVKIDIESMLFKEAPIIYPSDVVQVGSDVGWVDDVKIRCELANKALIVRHTMSIEKKV